MTNADRAEPGATAARSDDDWRPALGQLSRHLSAVSDLYAATFDIERDDLWRLAKLTEELGEVSAAYLKLTGRGRVGGETEDALKAALSAEIADLFAHVILFAEHNQIDLAEALAQKWLWRVPAPD